jgi:hypothetical protein
MVFFDRYRIQGRKKSALQHVTDMENTNTAKQGVMLENIVLSLIPGIFYVEKSLKFG